MIQLANDPNANRASYRPVQSEGKAALGHQRARSGHAWPFLSRQTHRPSQQDNPKPVANDSGS